MSKTLTGVLVAAVLVALHAVARALVDGVIAVPPDWAWVTSVAAAVLAALGRAQALPTGHDDAAE